VAPLVPAELRSTQPTDRTTSIAEHTKHAAAAPSVADDAEHAKYEVERLDARR